MMSGLSSYVGRDFVRLRLRLGRKLGGMGLKLASLRAPGQWNGSLGFAMVLKSCIVSGVFQAAVEMSGCPREQRSERESRWRCRPRESDKGGGMTMMLLYDHAHIRCLLSLKKKK